MARAPQVPTGAKDLKAERRAAHIRRLVDTMPPLTPAQGHRLALLLRGGDAA